MKLHIGGEEEKDGWTILNTQKKTENNIIGDICDLSQFNDESIEEVYASHILEHVRNSDIGDVLKNIFRILKTGGRFLISVPDLEILSKAILDPNLSVQNKYEITRIIYGGQTDDYDYHFFGFTQSIMSALLKNAGFIKVEKVEKFNIFKDTSEHEICGFPISLNAIGHKE